MGEERLNDSLEEAHVGCSDEPRNYVFTDVNFPPPLEYESGSCINPHNSNYSVTNDDYFSENNDLLITSDLHLMELSDDLTFSELHCVSRRRDNGENLETINDQTPFEMEDDLPLKELLNANSSASFNDTNGCHDNHKFCSCNEVNQSGSICPYCFLLQRSSSSGNKRKSEEEYDWLQEQILLSKQLVDESSSWLANGSYNSFKKARTPSIEDSLLLDCDVKVESDASLFTVQNLPSVEDKSDGLKVYGTYDDIKLIDLDVLEETVSALIPIDDLTFETLPNEIKLKIFSYLSQRELCTYVAPICSSWFHFSKDPSFWQSLSATEYSDVSSELLVRVITSWCKHATELEFERRSDISVTEFREIFQNCLNVECLSIAFCSQVNNEILSLVGTYCKCLTTINMEGCSNVSDRSFYNFIGLPLTRVNVSHCNMLSDDGGIFLVRNFKNLVEINFDGIQWMSEEFVKVLVDNHYETLEKVFLDGENLDDDVVRQISRCKCMRAMSFSFCTSMSHLAIEWVSQCHGLDHLQLRKGSNFTNASLLRFVKNMSISQGLAFRYLNLAECTEISDKALFYLSEKCPNLQVLDLSWCWEVSDDGIAHIIDNCNSLKEIFLKGLHELYGTPFFSLPTNIPKLKFLDLSQCNKIQDQLIEYIVERMRDLVIVNYYGEYVVNTRNSDANRYINM